MSLRMTLAASAAAIVALAAAGAQASTLYSGPASMPEMATNSSFDVTFNAPHAGAAGLSFALDGFASLDGQNWYEDDFTLSLDGAAIISGTWNLGGGGNDVVFSSPLGATFDNVSGNGLNITWNGGQVNITAPLDLAAGSNKLTFGYTSLAQGHAGFQGTGDEGWAAHDIVVTQEGAGGVPEPASWALMLLGFGGLGAALRHQRRPQRAAVAA
jgi:hypothetical protein